MSHQNYIDGDWITSETGDTFTVRNPADPDDVVGEFQQSNSADTERAIEAAAAAQSEWGETSGPTRGRYLRETAESLSSMRDELAKTLTREEGKTLSEARAEVDHAIELFYFYAEQARSFQGELHSSSSPDRQLSTIREPLGVVGLIASWNYPIAIPCWKLAPALAMGNASVLKPATNAPNVMRKVFECIDDVGFPDGVVNYVTGPGSEVGNTLTEHEAVNGVSFTGSTAVGTQVYENATTNQKRVQTEMGGKNPTLVMPSADVTEAVDIVGAGAFGVTGQACTATSRAIVHETILDDFIDGIVNYAESLNIGPGLDGADMGPQVDENERTGTLDYIQIGEDEGATLLTGGDEPDGISTDGYFVEPTVFTDVEPNMRIAQEEIFGPVLGIIPVGSIEEGIEIANGVDYGLSASIVTQNLGEAHQFLHESETGLVKVNEKTTGTEVHVPFGGVKGSSSNTYREQGEAALEFFTRMKTAYLNY